MMKNGLNDDILSFLSEALEQIEVLNLAQNSFTVKILDSLLSHFKERHPVKQKNVQLGQNNINNRRCRDKIE